MIYFWRNLFRPEISINGRYGRVTGQWNLHCEHSFPILAWKCFPPSFGSLKKWHNLQNSYSPSKIQYHHCQLMMVIQDIYRKQWKFTRIKAPFEVINNLLTVGFVHLILITTKLRPFLLKRVTGTKLQYLFTAGLDDINRNDYFRALGIYDNQLITIQTSSWHLVRHCRFFYEENPEKWTNKHTR